MTPCSTNNCNARRRAVLLRQRASSALLCRCLKWRLWARGLSKCSGGLSTLIASSSSPQERQRHLQAAPFLDAPSMPTWTNLSGLDSSTAHSKSGSSQPDLSPLPFFVTLTLSPSSGSTWPRLESSNSVTRQAALRAQSALRALYKRLEIFQRTTGLMYFA